MPSFRSLGAATARECVSEGRMPTVEVAPRDACQVTCSKEAGFESASRVFFEVQSRQICRVPAKTSRHLLTRSALAKVEIKCRKCRCDCELWFARASEPYGRDVPVLLSVYFWQSCRNVQERQGQE